ncbi:Vacuolar protein sorting-associated protein 35 [Entophlyctis sp. JEL0112]|nr:Vacuolar protein sorting-associated protein 35 [Entophlyctis sp. JEL0112]
MDALKHSSSMLAELKTGYLAPKGYYELYMAIFDQLRHLSTYLYEAHMNGRHHLSDIYELVQYAASIVPRLYLMITAGSVFLRVSRELSISMPKVVSPSAKGKEPMAQEGHDSSSDVPPPLNPVNPAHDLPPVKELLKDMLDMTLGVQHPIRGLFLRYYLTSMCRDYMPDGDKESVFGSRIDSIQFLLQNFVEMNKLWVRLQYIGHSREREQRELERRELKLLVGSNLLRLSQIEGLTPDLFSTMILPSVMSEVVNCRDILAQEYLMEVVIQVFPDDFHLRGLDLFLSATSQLSRGVNIKNMVLSLVNRFTVFARRNREDHAAKLRKEGVKRKAISGIPDDIRLFEIFWEQVRPEFQLHDVLSLLTSLIELTTGCYPSRLDHVDTVLSYAAERVSQAIANREPSRTDPSTAMALLQLLLVTLAALKADPLVFLTFPSSASVSSKSASTFSEGSRERVQYGDWSATHDGQKEPETRAAKSDCLLGRFGDLVRVLPFSMRKQLAGAFVDACVHAGTMMVPMPSNCSVGLHIRSVDGVDAVFGEALEVLMRDSADGGLEGAKIVRTDHDGAEAGAASHRITLVDAAVGSSAIDLDALLKDCQAVAKAIQVVGGFGDPDDDLELMGAVRRHIRDGGDVRLSALIFVLKDVTIVQRLNTLFEFMLGTIRLLEVPEVTSQAPKDGAAAAAGGLNSLRGSLPSIPTLIVNLYLTVAQSALECRNADVCYEALVGAITAYEDRVIDTRAQVPCITALVATVRNCAGVLSAAAYETLAEKIVGHCARLLRKPDQCACMMLAAHLYWPQERVGEDGEGAVGDHPVAHADAGIARDRIASKPRKAAKFGGLFGEDGSDNAAASDGADELIPVVRDGKKVLECLQKALKIADSVVEIGVCTGLFVQILELYVWFYVNGNDFVSFLNSKSSFFTNKVQVEIKFLNSLIELVNTNVSNNSVTAGVGSATNASRFVPDKVIRHYQNILARLKVLKDEEEEELESRGGLTIGSFGVAEGGFGESRLQGRWTELEF